MYELWKGTQSHLDPEGQRPGIEGLRAVHGVSRNPSVCPGEDGQGDTKRFLYLGNFRPAWPLLSPFLVLTGSACPQRGHIYGVEGGQEPPRISSLWLSSVEPQCLSP